MPRKKQTKTTTATTEKATIKPEPKSATASRSKSRAAKPKKSPTRSRKASKSTARSKSTAKRGRPAKSKAPVTLQDLSRESSVASETPEKKKPGRKPKVEKSVGKSKKEEKPKTTAAKTPGRPKSKGRPATKAKAAKSTSKAPKAKEVKEMKEEVQTRSARKSRKNEKKEERTPSPEPEPPKNIMTTPKRRKGASKTQVTPATEKARTRVKASVVCKKEDTISERSERDDHKGRSKKKEKKPAIPSRTQAKLLQKKMKKEQVDLPRFPTQEASIEGLIVEAIKGMKTKAMEDRIIGYLGKRFSDVDGGNIKNVLHRMDFDEKLLLRGLGGSVSCGKRDFDRADSDSMETLMVKKVKTSRNSSPGHKEILRGSRKMQTEDDRYDRKSASARMEIETLEGGEVKNEENSGKKMEEEKPAEVAIKEEAEKVDIPPIIIQEEEDIVLKLSAADSKKALIEYYEKKLLGIRGLLTTDKKDKNSEITPNPDQGITPNPVETPMPPQDEVMKDQEAKKEEQDEVRTTSVRRPELNESVEQIVSEKRNLSFDKEVVGKKQSGSKGKGQSDEKIEEDEGRGMVIWERQGSELDKTMGNESLKDGQGSQIELLMKLLTLPGVVTPDGADDQKVEETAQRTEEEKKLETSCEKIEETAENKAAEEASTKTEPKVEEPVEKAEEEVQKGANTESDSIRKKMRSAVESYLEMLQGRIDLDYSRENAENALSTSEEDKENKDVNKTANKDEDKKIDEDYVKEESDLERPQKLSVSKFLS